MENSKIEYFGNVNFYVDLKTFGVKTDGNVSYGYVSYGIAISGLYFYIFCRLFNTAYIPKLI